MTNLLCIFNPGGPYNKYFVIFNTFFGSTQGLFIAIFYCFAHRDVHEAFNKKYERYLAHRRAVANLPLQPHVAIVIQPRVASPPQEWNENSDSFRIEERQSGTTTIIEMEHGQVQVEVHPPPQNLRVSPTPSSSRLAGEDSNKCVEGRESEESEPQPSCSFHVPGKR